MSLIGSLLAFVVFPLKAKVAQPAPPKPDAEAFALDYWRKAYHALEDENERLRAERDGLRQQLELFNRLERIPQRQLGAQQAQQAQQAMLAQYQAQLGQYQAQIGQYQAQLGQLGQQSLLNQQAQNAQWHDCTCVPARANAFRNDNGQ